MLTDEAVETIARHDKQKPLFLYVAELAPHTGNEFDPLQAPADEVAKFDYIKGIERRTYAAMVSLLDQSVGRIVKALDKKKMLDNSILLFFSDNGAPVVGKFIQHSIASYPCVRFDKKNYCCRTTRQQRLQLSIQRSKWNGQ